MKKLQGLEEIGLTVDKKHECAYGVVDGYKFIVTFHPQARQYSIITSVKTQNETDTLSQYLETMDKGTFINWMSYANEVVTVNVKNDKHLTVWDLNKIMKDIAAFAYQNGYVQCCHHCHEEIAVDACSLNGQNDLMCSHCLSQFSINAPEPKPINVPLGILGALIGSLIGVIAWLVIYNLGFIAGITGFIMAVCCFKGYEMLGGRIDRQGLWIALIIAVVMLAVAEMLSLGLEIMSVYNDYYDMGLTIFDAMQAVPYFLGDSDILWAVIKDLAFGYIFMAAASFSYIKNLHKIVATDGVIERMG